MKEKMHYFSIPGNEERKLFVHEHIPDACAGKAVLFLNPLFDEKKHVQRFQAETARALCSRQFHVMRFDYFCTGDSGGEVYRFNPEEALVDIDILCKELKSRPGVEDIILLGIRAGADLALRFAEKNKYIHSVVIIEPLANGGRFLTEQRIRRKAFMKINRIEEGTDQVIIQGRRYEDHQGYPWSEEFLSFMNGLLPEATNLKGTRIYLIKLDTLFSKKQIEQLRNRLSLNNQLFFQEVKHPDFWSTLEPVVTLELTNKILNIPVLAG